MVAERLDRVDEAEARLRRVVELKPDDAQALNALGYTLVDRTHANRRRLCADREARTSSRPTTRSSSTAWAGRCSGSAATPKPRPTFAARSRNGRTRKIAAHLGEVLWAKGERDRAQEIWQSQLKTTPDNAVLLETVRRLGGDQAVAISVLAHALAAWSLALLAACATARRAGPPPATREPSPRSRRDGRIVGAARQRGHRGALRRGATRRAPTTSMSRRRSGRSSRGLRRRFRGCARRAARRGARRLSRLERAHPRRCSASRFRSTASRRGSRARPSRASASDLERDAAGRPQVLRQQGWEIVYAFADDASARSDAPRDALSRQRADRGAHRRRSLATRGHDAVARCAATQSVGACLCAHSRSHRRPLHCAGIDTCDTLGENERLFAELWPQRSYDRDLPTHSRCSRRISMDISRAFARGIRSKSSRDNRNSRIQSTRFQGKARFRWGVPSRWKAPDFIAGIVGSYPYLPSQIIK